MDCQSNLQICDFTLSLCPFVRCGAVFQNLANLGGQASCPPSSNDGIEFSGGGTESSSLPSASTFRFCRFHAELFPSVHSH